MVTPAAHTAFGTILAFGNNETPSEEFTAVGRVKDVKGPSISRETIDVTNHQSPEGYAQFLASLADGGEVTFTIEYDQNDPTHDGMTGLLALAKETTTRNWRLISPVESATPGEYNGLAFAALVTGFSPSYPVKGSITADITLKVAGEVTEGHWPITTLC